MEIHFHIKVDVCLLIEMVNKLDVMPSILGIDGWPLYNYLTTKLSTFPLNDTKDPTDYREDDEPTMIAQIATWKWRQTNPSNL